MLWHSVDRPSAEEQELQYWAQYGKYVFKLYHNRYMGLRLRMSDGMAWTGVSGSEGTARLYNEVERQVGQCLVTMMRRATNKLLESTKRGLRR